jgi:GNAT superfamily N-acetyltransferase
MNALTLAVTAHPLEADVTSIGAHLAAFNDADVGPANRVPVLVTFRDAGGALVAGTAGYTAWGWLYVQWLWVAESQRGQGLAGRMLAAAEAEACGRGCHGAWIDTFSPVALKTYQRAGYTPFGALEDFPVGRTRTFLQKRL